MEWFIWDHTAWESRRGYCQAGAALPLGLPPDLCEGLQESPVTWTLPYKGRLTANQGAAWLVEGSSMVSGQHPVCEATTLSKQDRNRSALWLSCRLFS